MPAPGSTPRRLPALAAACLLAGLVAACGRGPREARSPAPEPAAAGADTVAFGPGHARARLLADPAAAVPGDTLILGVDFTVQPEWHLYWNGRNDTGFPIQVRPRLPEGFAAGALEWPAPERHLSAGNILDHVYTDSVTLLLPVAVPAGAAGRDSVTLAADLLWLACREACLPGSASVRLTLPVAADRASAPPPPPDAAARFAEARARLPRPLTPADGVAVGEENGAPALRADGASGLAFYPFTDSAPLAQPIAGATARGDRLALVPSPDAPPGSAFRGVLEVDRPGRAPAFYVLDTPARPGP